MRGVPAEAICTKNGLLIDVVELRTLTAYVPGVIRSAPLIVALSVPSAFSVVTSSFPLKMIFEVERNDVPLTMMSCDRMPAVIAPGWTFVICGAKTASGDAAEVAPL